MLIRMTALVAKERKYFDRETMDEFSTKFQSEKTPKHLRTGRRTKKLFTLGNGEFFLMYLFVVLHGSLFVTLVPTDAKLLPGKTPLTTVTHDLHETEKNYHENDESISRGKQYRDIPSQGKIFYV